MVSAVRAHHRSESRARAFRRALILVAALAALWTLIIGLTGGIFLSVPWGRFSSRGPLRPFAIAVAATVWYALRYRRHWSSDVGRLASAPWPSLAAAAMSLGAIVIGIHWGTFVAGGADQSGYLSQAEMWLHGKVTTPTPEWTHGATWPDAAWTSAPLGYRPQDSADRLVPVYPPGFPLILAVIERIGQKDAAYYVVPVFGGLTVVGTYLIAAELAGPWAGVIAAALMLSSPIFLTLLVETMSDIVATAFWSLALYGALRIGLRGTVLAAIASSLAIVVRPNLAPLVLVVGCIVAFTHVRKTNHLIVFALTVAPTAVAIGALNTYWYGSALNSGYGDFRYIYSSDRLWSNLRNYVGWMVQSQTFVVALALAAPFLARNGRALLTLVVIVFPASIIALYLPYLVFESWSYVRFMLPAYPALLAGVAVTVMWLNRRLSNGSLAGAMTILGVSLLVVHGFTFFDAPFKARESEQRYLRMAAYVRTLPSASVIVSLNHSGTLNYYTGRDVLRWELLDPAYLDTAVEYLWQRGHPVYLAADTDEIAPFKRRFAGSGTVRHLETIRPLDLAGSVIYPLATAETEP